MEALDNLISNLQSSKDSRLVRRGFSPAQLVIGNVPNLLGETLADPSCCIASDQEILLPPADRDMMGRQYVLNHESGCRMQEEFARKDRSDRIARA